MSIKTLAFLGLILASIAVANGQQTTCKALVMEGGGDLGAYEVGVLAGFVNNAQNPEDFQYDVVTGISIGAINGMAFAQYPIGQEKQAVDFLVSQWGQANQRDVFKSWAGGYLQGLFFEPALVDNDAEIDFLKSQIWTVPNKRRITVATTDFATGEKVTFSEKDWAGEDDSDLQMAINAALWSSAVPVFFKYRNYQGRTFVDGGWSGEGLDIEDAIFRCKEIVDTDEQIIVDVLFASNVSFADASKNKFNAFQIYQRQKAVHKYAASTRAYQTGVDAYPDVNYRYVMIASQRLPDQTMPLDFKHENIEFMINLGTQDAINAMAEGAGVSAKRVYDMSVQYQNDLFFNTAS